MSRSLLLVVVLSISFSANVFARKHNGDYGDHPKKEKIEKDNKNNESNWSGSNSSGYPESKKGFTPPNDLVKEIIKDNEDNSSESVPNSDRNLIKAVNDRRDLFFVEGANVKVIQVMPDDNDGLRHQRWYVQLSDGQKVFAVYNIDMTQRVPLEVNQVMALGGEFKMTNQGPLIHWLHEDPKEKRPDGYVDLNGFRYGKVK